MLDAALREGSGDCLRRARMTWLVAAAALLSGLHGHSNGMYGLQHRTHHFESFDRVRGLMSCADLFDLEAILVVERVDHA